TKESEIASRETSVATRERDATAERQVIEQDKAKLAQREQAVTQAEQKCDAGFADELAALNDELREKRAQGERAIAEMREKNLSALEVEISELKA
ncbi:chromosome partitioning protein ParA, partial [Pseudomonas aeruginosa]|nr:chromosome partitioning protein ParA [Pseudomonas aeruginosa]